MDTLDNNLRLRIQQIYEQHIKPLTLHERMELAAVIQHDVEKQAAFQSNAGTPSTTPLLAQRAGRVNRKWQEIAGSISPPLNGEDTQAWVSRTRQESDVSREH